MYNLFFEQTHSVISWLPYPSAYMLHGEGKNCWNYSSHTSETKASMILADQDMYI